MNDKSNKPMNIKITNCNNIDEGIINIEKNKLSIKYGLNGTGKSTIVKAIDLYLNNSQNLSALKPFKHQNNESQIPQIKGIEDLSSIMIYNEAYINQFVFKQDEVISNSFDIFIKTPDYLAKMMEIEKLIYEIRNFFKTDDKIEKIIKDLSELSDSFGKSKTGFAESGRINKAIGKGNKIENIPDSLIKFTPHLKSTNNVAWIKWQIEGNKFLEVSELCPYCTSPTNNLKETIKAVSVEFDANSIQHLNKLIEILQSLGEYFNTITQDNLQIIIKNKSDLSTESINYLKEIKGQIDTLKEKLITLKEISFFSIKDEANIEEKIKALKINLDLLTHLNSHNTKQIIDEINNRLDSVLSNISKLKGEINQQKSGIQKAIQKNQKEINEFLKYAGYNYFVEIVDEINSYKMKLRHVDLVENIEDSSNHLSFGEKNAFSLVLFMYECISKNPDLIVLDDPISSFDKNKKFAISEKLFKGDGSLQNRTVLMLTHDLEPIIDIIKTLKGRFQPIPSASFLRNSNGSLTEIAIENNDIQSATEVCLENINQSRNIITRIIYLRRYFEITNNKSFEYHILSSIIHKREQPTDGNQVNLSEDEIHQGILRIKNYISDFDYPTVLASIINLENIKTLYNEALNNYEKLQLFRVIYQNKGLQTVLQKFINETFHIENDYLMQLNPSKYEIVPQYIIESCNELINTN